MSTLKVGVLGYGWVATAHIAAIEATGMARVVAVHSSRPLDEAALASRHGHGLRVHARLEDMLADPAIDVVTICSYPWLHAEHARAAARAGKHIILEKPVALSWDDCVSVRDAVARAGVLTCVCFECRYSAQFLATRSLLDAGMLGEVHYGEVDYYHGIGPWYGQYRWNTLRSGGGSSLLSAGCHAMDALLLCMGTDVEEVHSYAVRSRSVHFKDYEYETTSATLVRFRDGRLGKTASVIDCLQPYYFHTHLVGSEGSLLDHRFHTTRIAGLDKGRWSQLSFAPVDSGDVKDHPYQTQFEAFFRAVREGRQMGLTSLADALHTHRVIFAADESARTGRPVKLA